jgi:PIN domain nuclease of toxin-antitoxin system
MKPLLLDTHIWVWYAEGNTDRLRPADVRILDSARRNEELFVSSISVWEIGMHVAKGRVQLSVPLREWVDRTLNRRGLRFFPIDARTATETTQLPDGVHDDPADRFLIATARVHGITLVTRDEAILAYGEAGFVRTLAL